MEENNNNKTTNELNAKLDELLLSQGLAKIKNPAAESQKPAKPRVCVVGMGYVGFPLAVMAAAKGYEVFGLDTDLGKLKLIDQGVNIVKEKYLDEILPKVKINTLHDPRPMRPCDIFLICVPTPVDEKYYPILEPIVNASKTIAENMKKGVLVILESTVNPGVCEEIIKPIFEKAGHLGGRDFFLAHCPERVNPGDPKWNVTNIPRVLGALDETGLKLAQEFYQNVIEAPIMLMKTIREAEATKIVENSFRDINIAFVNELAKSFDKLGIDIVNVIRGAATKPFAFLAHWPSCGVGGHCIPVDPYYLIEKAKENDFDHRFLRVAREINNSMPHYTVETLQEALNKIEKSIKGTNIGILGISYKANVSDLRRSPSLEIIKILKDKGAKLHLYDPHLTNLSTVKNIEELLEKSEALILATNHLEFLQIPVEKFKDYGIKVIVDGKNSFNKDKIKNLGIIYKGIGR